MSQQVYRPYKARPYGTFRGTFRGGSRAYPSSLARRRVPEALGERLGGWRVDGMPVSECSSEEAKITNQKVVTSYNLTGKSSTTILVPGAPPLYTPPLQPTQLKDDMDGEYFREQNAARFPKHAMEPAVKSLFTSQPTFDTSDIDVFACGSTIGNLLWLMFSKFQDFSLVVHIISNTAFFLRRDQSPTELIKDVVGFGHAFPEAYTTWEADVKRSSSHQRVLAYEFGGMKFLLRYEGDGYLGEGKPESDHIAGDSSSTSVEEMLSDLLSEHPTSSSVESGIEKRGHTVDQSSVFDLKTRSIKKIHEDIVEEELPRLWMRQIPNFILAFHRSGIFEDIRIQHVKARILAWEAQNAPVLCRLAGLISDIVEYAGHQSNRKVEVRGTETGEISFHVVEEEGWNALPPWLEEKWTNACVTPHERIKDLETISIHSGSSRRSSGDVLDEEEDSQDEYVNNASEHGSVEDYTACSAEDCGYCGHCSY